jgi:hypothetical protein
MRNIVEAEHMKFSRSGIWKYETACGNNFFIF